MDKQQAIEYIKSIQNGDFDRNKTKAEMPVSKLAENSWEEPVFQLGMEYGAIAVLMDVFGITGDELK